MGDETEGTGGEERVTVGLVRQIVNEALSGIKDKADEDTGTRQAGRRALNSRLDRDSDLEEKVAKAAQQIKDQEDRQRQESELKADIAALKEKIKDTPPVERNWAHKLMGWGE
jgi:chromosome segregation ATPase